MMVAAAPVIDVGIRVDADPQRARVTIDCLRRQARDARFGRLFLLVEPDVCGAEEAVDGAATVVRLVRAGGATALNALIEVSGAPVVAYLESGIEPAAGALERLARALSADGVGLVGPSTNLSWNEQRCRDAPRGRPTAEALERYAATLARRHGDGAPEMAPLHTLSDFCLLLRRDTLAAVGGADDAYDPGPCWEMDLAVRAHRAGWRALWVQAAYVHRAPVPALRREREAEFALASKRRFQERFCGRFLRAENPAHRAYCRGDDCPNFAPAPLLASAAARTMPLSRVGRASASNAPLVSCILPTASRPAFVVEAVRNFLAQDYARRELVVVDDGEVPVAHLLPVDERIRYVRLAGGRQPIGVKRNVACANARGEIIAHVDDDDWYPPHRLTAQVRALADNGAAVSGTSSLYFFDPVGGRAWLHAGANPGRLAGTSLVYRRALWERQPFAPLAAGEDSELLGRLAEPAAVVDLADPELCVATVHARNTTPKGRPGPSWRAVDRAAVESRLGARAAAYRAAAAGAPAPLPLVSCIMPTRDRPELVALAVKKFHAQDYPLRELIVLDDGELSVGDIVAGQPGVRYLRMDRRDVTVGEKRNIACDMAAGEVICIWDDDDWYAPERLRCQVLPIIYDETDMTGLRCDHLLCLPSGEVWAVSDEVHRRMFESDVAGGTIAFRRSILRDVRFPHISLAEDAALIRMARARGYRLKHISNHGVFAYVRHPRNTWRFEPGRFYDARAWRRAELPPTFSADMLAAHRDACSAWLARQPA